MSRRRAGRAPLLILVVSFTTVALAACGSSRAGDDLVATRADIGHVHDIVVEDGDVYLAAHTGLFRVEGPSRAVLVGRFRHDFMSMTSVADGLAASGHPDLRYDEWRVEGKPAHLGFIRSNDDGATWEKTALLGEVDFHSLTARADDGFYGADSAGGVLASDDGEEWEVRSDLSAVDLSASPTDADSVLAVESATGIVLSSVDGASTWNPIAGVPQLVRLQWRADGLFGLASDGAMYWAADVAGVWDELGRVDTNPVAFTSAGDEWWVVTEQGTVLHADDGTNFRVLYQAPER